MGKRPSYNELLQSNLANEDLIAIEDIQSPGVGLSKYISILELNKQWVTKSGNSVIDGDLTVDNIFGNGAALEGITGATGGIENTGTTTIKADTDVNGSGVIALQTRNITRLTAENNGDITIETGGDLIVLDSLAVGIASTTVGFHLVSDKVSAVAIIDRDTVASAAIQDHIQYKRQGVLVGGIKTSDDAVMINATATLHFGIAEATKAFIDVSGDLTVNSLAGTGTRNVVVDANGKMTAP